MSVTYTRRLWTAPDLGPGVTLGPEVPSDQLWVVRHVTMFFPGNAYGQSSNDITILENSSGAVVTGVGESDAVPGRVYDIDTRQVLNPFDRLAAVTSKRGWYLLISGFIFAAP